MIIVSCLLMEKQSFKFKANNKTFIFLTQFCLGSISNGFGATESREVSLKGNVCNFSADYNGLESKSNIK